jgi:hypothetical protein
MEIGHARRNIAGTHNLLKQSALQFVSNPPGPPIDHLDGRHPSTILTAVSAAVIPPGLILTSNGIAVKCFVSPT